jgi:hypothetical protein
VTFEVSSLYIFTSSNTTGKSSLCSNYNDYSTCRERILNSEERKDEVEMHLQDSVLRYLLLHSVILNYTAFLERNKLGEDYPYFDGVYAKKCPQYQIVIPRYVFHTSTVQVASQTSKI